MRKRNWSFDELEFIKENYNKMTYKELSKYLNASESTIRNYAKRILGFKERKFYKNKITRKTKRRGNDIINIKCKICNKVVKVFRKSLSGMLQVCGDCIKRLWGSKEILEIVDESDLAYQEKLELKNLLRK